MPRILGSIVVMSAIGSMLVPLFSPSAASTAASSVTVKAGATAELVLGDPLGSKRSTTGDRFACQLKQPIRVDGAIVLPARTRILGHVDSVRPYDGTLGRSEIRLILESISLPSGKLAANFRILSVDQRATEDRDHSIPYRNYGEYGQGANGSRTGRYNGVGSGVTVPADDTMAPPFTSNVSVFGDSLGGRLTGRRGDVVLSPGTVFRVKLANTITVPVGEETAPDKK